MSGMMLSEDWQGDISSILPTLQPPPTCFVPLELIERVDNSQARELITRPKTNHPGQLATSRESQFPALSRVHKALQTGARQSKRQKRTKLIRRARQRALRDIESLLSPYVQPSFLKDQPWIDVALHQWLNVKRPRSWRDFDLEHRLGISVDKISNWIRYIAMNDPAIFCVEACASAFFSLPMDSDSMQKHLWLENHCCTQINLSLNDPSRRLSSLTIFAIILCASYYAFCGDFRVARDVHVPGLRRMLALKGEKKFVEELPACIVALSVWYAREVTKLCGVSEPIFSWSGPDGGDLMPMIRAAVSEDLKGSLLEGRRDSLLDD
ncbi:hypothetical protein M409DRAFT_29953 [Zasmidium cellare ATCC 36951]|uniref:Transcription factor domain-containing protein n=1 Tax=Zasmidium cellare ATCC 36951 TaxID=1080233 RepID=A0A6A6BXU7_ZASCE|nr:uncharacterized protein M409DRAFT_29953 [Zasmidium cellare ATCC 36951]KAF2159634.1 hypothetical protein M409DRAFT_29953 [Zasmidium cellare ATCC 36951]